MGAWEISLGYMANLSRQCPKQIVVRLPRDSSLVSVMMSLRSVGQVEVVPHRQASRSVVNCLRQNGVAGFRAVVYDSELSGRPDSGAPFQNRREIGRASCRERV